MQTCPNRIGEIQLEYFQTLYCPFFPFLEDSIPPILPLSLAVRDFQPLSTTLSNSPSSNAISHLAWSFNSTFLISSGVFTSIFFFTICLHSTLLNSFQHIFPYPPKNMYRSLQLLTTLPKALNAHILKNLLLHLLTFFLFLYNMKQDQKQIAKWDIRSGKITF